MSSTARSSATMNDDQPPRKKMAIQSPEMSIFCLPFDLIFNIISRVSRLYYPTFSLVSKKFRSVVASPELYETRSRLKRTESCLYVCLRYHRDHPLDPNPYWFTLSRKPNRTLTDGSSGLVLIPVASPDVRHEPSSSVVAVGSNIYKIGGHTPSSSEVSVLDCRFNTWNSAPTMREKRSSPAASLVDGKIYVAGGFEELSSVNYCVEVFDPKTRTWGCVTTYPGVNTQLPRPELKSFGLGGKLYLLIGGDEDAVYDPKEASWNPIGLGMHMDNMYEAMDMEMDMNGVASAVSYYHGVIGDVLFLWNEREFRWFDSNASSWKKLYGHLPDFDGDFKMVDVAGKMVVLWKVFGRSDEHGDQERSIWCAEIELERRDGGEMWGNVEWCDAVLKNYEPCGLFDADVLCVTV